MISLSYCEHELEYIVNIIHNAFDIDTAIFDTDANLIISTDSYLIHKGKAVHAPSIQEVILKDNVIVNEPGHMDSCIGCRFKDHCPSTIEILKCIKSGDDAVGVLTFTAFSKDGHDKITQDVKFYKNLVENFSQLISVLIIQKHYSHNNGPANTLLLSALDTLDDGFISTDINGNIESINASALELFSSCGMFTKSIHQFFPENTVSAIMSGRILSNYKIKLKDENALIFSSPIQSSNQTIGFAIRISYKKSLSILNSPNSDNVCLPYSIDSLIGKSEHIKTLKKTVLKIASSPSTVFISGETGTGKSLLAKALHYESIRRNKPFIMVNCTSIPESLFESELFGYESGAFTGAKKEGKPGKFELANGGTLFLDEISEIPVNIQAKLLSVIQESSFERVGGISPINIDVRIIAASNRNLEEMIEEKKFRSDLYYRLNVIPIELIPLRNRKDDIIILTTNFLEHYTKKLNRIILGFDDRVVKLFNDYSWPGNIRQLENIVEYCVNMAEGKLVTTEDLPPDFTKNCLRSSETTDKIKDSEYNIIVDTINKYGWDVKGKTLAAKELNIGLRTLYRKLSESDK